MNNTQETKQTVQLGFRIGFVAILLVGVSMTTFMPEGFLPVEKVDCLRDTLFEWTETQNRFFANNPNYKYSYMILCGMMMDIMVVTLLYFFAFKGTTWRFPIALCLNHILRFMVMNLFLLRYPEGYLWEFPGVYSLTVPYGRTNDFFYSGHLSTATICLLEFRALGFKWMTLFSGATLVMQTFLMLFLRGHYMIDLLAGCIFGFFFFYLAQKLSFYIDVKVFKIPFKKRFPGAQRYCDRCKCKQYMDSNSQEDDSIREGKTDQMGMYQTPLIRDS